MRGHGISMRSAQLAYDNAEPETWLYRYSPQRGELPAIEEDETPRCPGCNADATDGQEADGYLWCRACFAEGERYDSELTALVAEGAL